ncbi:MAG: hypothetical protein QM723_15330 [Myxococcaceae bacterium]
MVFLCRDTDGNAERVKGALQAQAANDWPFKVVLAIAAPEVEAWWIATANPTPGELASETQRLGFDPRIEPHRLSSSPESPADAKTVAKNLGADRAWRDVSFETIEKSAVDFLSLFVRGVHTSVVPLFDPRPQ